MNKIGLLIPIIFLINDWLYSQENQFQLNSPDNKLEIIIGITQVTGVLHYQIDFDNQPVVLESKFGITCNKEGWDSEVIITNSTVRQQDMV